MPPDHPSARICLNHIDVRRGAEIVLRDVAVDLKGRGLTALMGVSGIGKSTLLGVIAGLVKPTAGTRQVDGKVAMIFQDPRLLPWQSALDNAGFGLRAAGFSKDEARDKTRLLLERFGLRPADHGKRPSALSGGMRQRVAIARALAIDPGVLLMDEPFTGLDVSLRADLRQLARAIVDERNLTAILVTHDPVEAVMLCDRVMLLAGQPAYIAADVAISPRSGTMVEAYRAASTLMRRLEVESGSIVRLA